MNIAFHSKLQNKAGRDRQYLKKTSKATFDDKILEDC